MAPHMQRPYQERLALAKPLWGVLGDIPTDGDPAGGPWIDRDFLHFCRWDDVEDVWHWFEEAFKIKVADLMYGGPETGESEK